MSENGKLKIADSMITMYDTDNTLRFECGYKVENGDSKYVFALYNEAGENSIYIDDGGNAVFAGEVRTDKDATIGEHLNLSVMSSESARSSIRFVRKSGANAAEIACDNSGNIWIVTTGNAYLGLNRIATEVDIKALNDNVVEIGAVVASLLFDVNEIKARLQAHG